MFFNNEQIMEGEQVYIASEYKGMYVISCAQLKEYMF
jgi:hypothetical protein